VDALGYAGEDRRLVAQYLIDAGNADASQRIVAADARIEIERRGVSRRDRRRRSRFRALLLSPPFRGEREGRVAQRREGEVGVGMRCRIRPLTPTLSSGEGGGASGAVRRFCVPTDESLFRTALNR
jgi:hypothetical protein